MGKSAVAALLCSLALPAVASTASVSISNISWNIGGPPDLWISGLEPDLQVTLPDAPGEQSARTRGASLNFSLAPGATFETSVDMSYEVSSDKVAASGEGRMRPRASRPLREARLAWRTYALRRFLVATTLP